MANVEKSSEGNGGMNEDEARAMQQQKLGQAKQNAIDKLMQSLCQGIN